MKKIISSLALFCISQQLFADPYIVPSQGIGQYGYLELNATTYVRLNHGGFNVRELAARWWTGNEYLYYPGDAGSCAQHEQSTSDYGSGNHNNWVAGTVAYVSARFKDCSSNWNPTNYNERSFRLISLDNNYGGGFDDDITDNPTTGQNLVGSFTLEAGGALLTLDRLWLRNVGSAQEVSDIPNGAIRIYYEDITGSETFNGTEAFKTIYGDWGGNNTDNEEWGSDDLNLSIGSNGVRCYVVVADLAGGFSVGNTIQFEIISDGISFQEVRDGSYNKLRADAVLLSPSSAPLPVKFRAFTAEVQDGKVLLHWETEMERNNRQFELDRSPDGLHWQPLAVIPGRNGDTPQSYHFTDETPLAGANYYRLKQVDYDGAGLFAPIVVVQYQKDSRIGISPNPVRNGVVYIHSDDLPDQYWLRIVNAGGTTVYHQMTDNTGSTGITLPRLSPGIYYVYAANRAPICLVIAD